MDMFQLWRFEILPSVVFDQTDRAIGAYQRECQRLHRKIFNPLYWLGLLISGILHLPFRLLGAAGFDAARAEKSLAGKLLKLAVATVLFFATVIPAVFVLSDHWDQVKHFGSLFGHRH